MFWQDIFRSSSLTYGYAILIMGLAPGTLVGFLITDLKKKSPSPWIVLTLTFGIGSIVGYFLGLLLQKCGVIPTLPALAVLTGISMGLGASIGISFVFFIVVPIGREVKEVGEIIGGFIFDFLLKIERDRKRY